MVNTRYSENLGPVCLMIALSGDLISCGVESFEGVRDELGTAYRASQIKQTTL